MKKLLSLLLCVLMMAGLVPVALAQDAESVSLLVWNEPNEDQEMDMYYQAGQTTGINVDITVIPETEYSSKLNQMIAAKNDADIMVVWECDIANFAAAKGILPLDDYLADSTIDTDDFIDAVASLSAGLGSTYGLPWCAATEIMYYNEEMFDAAGIAHPTNDWAYEDFLAAARALTQYNEDGSTAVYGCTLPNLQTWWAGVGMAGDQIFDPATGEMVIGEGAVDFVTDCATLVEEGVMPAPSSDDADLFSSGMAAMSWQGSWQIFTYADMLTFNWDIAALPVNKLQYNTLHTGFYTIASACKNPDAAWTVVEYLMGEEGQRINSASSGNPSALLTIANKGEWKVESATTVANWDAITTSLACGVFGYTCLPAGVTGNAVSLFESALLGQITPEEAVQQASDYAAETIGY